MATAPPPRSAPTSLLLLLAALFLGAASPLLAFRAPSIATRRAEVAPGTHHWREAPTTSPAAGSSFGGRRSLAPIRMGASSSRAGEVDPEAYRDKSILITGASRGLGRSLARALSKCGPSLLILSGRDEDALKEVRDECSEIAKEHDGPTRDGGRVEVVPCDLADGSSVERLAAESLRLARESAADDGEGGPSRSSGVVDVLINNGGISSRSSFLESGIDVDERLMRVNFFSGAALAKALVPGMVEGGGGRVVWISSVQGKLGTPYRTSYAASKFAVQGYCEALRSELASSGVSVHIVSPGYIRTNLSMSAVMGDGRAYSRMDETTANGADPDEVAATILNSVSAGKSDFVVAATLSAKVAMWLRFLAPMFLEGMLVKRFEKQRLESKKED